MHFGKKRMNRWRNILPKIYPEGSFTLIIQNAIMGLMVVKALILCTLVLILFKFVKSDPSFVPKTEIGEIVCRREQSFLKACNLFTELKHYLTANWKTKCISCCSF